MSGGTLDAVSVIETTISSLLVNAELQVTDSQPVEISQRNFDTFDKPPQDAYIQHGQANENVLSQLYWQSFIKKAFQFLSIRHLNRHK